MKWNYVVILNLACLPSMKKNTVVYAKALQLILKWSVLSDTTAELLVSYLSQINTKILLLIMNIWIIFSAFLLNLWGLNLPQLHNNKERERTLAGLHTTNWKSSYSSVHKHCRTCPSQLRARWWKYYIKPRHQPALLFIRAKSGYLTQIENYPKETLISVSGLTKTVVRILRRRGRNKAEN